MIAVQIYNHPEFGGMRVIGDFDNPRFCLSDLCKILELDASQVMKRLDDGVVSIHPITDKLGRMQNANFVNEDGLYDVILDSRKPEAKKFRKWITSEVLPSIRKTGSYALSNKPSVEAGLQRVGLLVRVAEHKAVPQSEQLRLLNMAVRELTGTELNVGKSSQESQSMELGIMELPEVFGMIKRKKSKKFGKYTFYFYPVTEIADMVGVSPLKFNQFADEHGLKCLRHGMWERVKTPQGDAREFMYTQEVTLQYSE